MESKISIYISTLKDYQIKGMKYEGIDDKDGTIYQKSEAGIEFNIIRWINHKYTLSLQYLTFQECENIIRELIKIKQERKLLNIPKELIVKKGYIDFKSMPNDPFFSYKIEDISPKQSTGKPYYDLSIKLNERVDML